MNLFIVDSDSVSTASLEKSLSNRFDPDLSTSVFEPGEACLTKLDESITVVALAFHLSEKNGNETLKSVKLTNPNTEVTLLSNNKNVITATETLRLGTSDNIVKGDRTGCKLHRTFTERQLS